MYVTETAASYAKDSSERPALQRALNQLDIEQDQTNQLIDALDARLGAVCTPLPPEPAQPPGGLRGAEPVASPTTGTVNATAQRQAAFNVRLRRLLSSLEV